MSTWMTTSLNLKFSKVDFQSKQEIISKGRTTPELKGLLQSMKQKGTPSFQMEWYTRKDWLCGCSARNRLFCFPCLLFSTCGTVWTQAGFCDCSYSKPDRQKAFFPGSDLY
ncbi:hypothetical protein AMECASPLE_013815 [Ameca splendens]|uniref:Uncharacterized protein n=1 Tax=Ameca splendens TaxID=208324 RepID=A0ABV0ZAB0_9TELE